MSEKWDAYITEFEEKPASFFVDLGLVEEAPISGLPWSLYIRLYLLNPRPDGLTQGDEFEVLQAIEDSILKELKGHKATYAGRMTTDGKRVMVFYTLKEFDAAPLLERALERFPEYQCETWCTEDSEWHFYSHCLYPRPEEMQTLHNRWVVEALEKDGDTLEKAREVNHWIYFEDERNRAAFVEAVEALGYRVDTSIAEEWAPKIYQAWLSRVDHVDQTSINEVVLQLFRLANHHEGEYDGWETGVETGKPAEPKRPWWKKILKN